MLCEFKMIHHMPTKEKNKNILTTYPTLFTAFIALIFIFMQFWTSPPQSTCFLILFEMSLAQFLLVWLQMQDTADLNW